MPSHRDHFRKFVRKSYEARRFANPMLAKPDRPKRRALGWVALAAVLAAILIGGSAYALTSSEFAVDAIRVDGAESIPVAEIETVVRDYLSEPVFGFARRGNRWLFRPEILVERLRARFSLESVSVGRENRTAVVRIGEKISQLIWSVGGGWFLTDLEGEILRPMTAQERAAREAPPAPDVPPLPPLPLVIDENGAVPKVGERVLSPEEVQGILAFQEALARLGIAFAETRIDRLAGKWTAVRTMEGFDVLFDPTGDVAAQAAKLDTVLRTAIADRSKLRYIDLRFGDHVYYK
jgi:hypothetical protein